jgi:hypothetical protein
VGGASTVIGHHYLGEEEVGMTTDSDRNEWLPIAQRLSIFRNFRVYAAVRAGVSPFDFCLRFA